MEWTAGASARVLGGGDEGDAGGEYNVGLQVAGVFILIAASVLGIVSSYVLARRHGRDGLAGTTGALAVAVVFVKGLSCGVVISVALVHLISEAYELFAAVPGWDTFQPWPMVFTMVGIYVMAVIETIANRTFGTSALHSHSGGNSNSTAAGGGGNSNSTATSGAAEQANDVNYRSFATSAAAQASPTSTGKDDINIVHSQRLSLTATVIEAGILFHSLIIGFDLGLQSQPQWGPVCAAIAAHQFLEGLMMGQVLGDMRNGSREESRNKVWCMMLFFIITVSVGVCIGILVHATVSTENQAALDITVAILNCLSGGFLLYLGIASLLVPWFVSNEALRNASNVYASVAYAGIAVGITAMTAIALAE